MNVIECKNVTKAYRSFKALNEISLTISENTITGLVGRNGAGKTTLLKILAGFWHETSGEVRVFSEKPFNNIFVSANMIYIDDQMSFGKSLTLSDILEEAGRFYANWDARFANRLFDYFSFHPRQKHAQLSKGKKSTFNMIIGLAARTALTIYDEPTTGMDMSVRSDFYRALLKDYIAYPRTIILSSHHLDEIENLIEDVLLIEAGQKILHLSVDEFKEYAIGVTGTAGLIEELIKSREVYLKQKVGTEKEYVVVKSEKGVTEQAKRLGLDITIVSPSDLSMYLTNKMTGGIDDVFSEG